MSYVGVAGYTSGNNATGSGSASIPAASAGATVTIGVCWGTATGATLVVPAGYTILDQYDNGQQSAAILGKYMSAASAGGNLTITLTGGTARWSWIATVEDGQTGLPVVSISSASTNGTTHVTNSQTVAAPGGADIGSFIFERLTNPSTAFTNNLRTVRLTEVGQGTNGVTTSYADSAGPVAAGSASGGTWTGTASTAGSCITATIAYAATTGGGGGGGGGGGNTGTSTVFGATTDYNGPHTAQALVDISTQFSLPGPPPAARLFWSGSPNSSIPAHPNTQLIVSFKVSNLSDAAMIAWLSGLKPGDYWTYIHEPDNNKWTATQITAWQNECVRLRNLNGGQWADQFCIIVTGGGPGGFFTNSTDIEDYWIEGTKVLGVDLDGNQYNPVNAAKTPPHPYTDYTKTINNINAFMARRPEVLDWIVPELEIQYADDHTIDADGTLHAAWLTQTGQQAQAGGAAVVTYFQSQATYQQSYKAKDVAAVSAMILGSATVLRITPAGIPSAEAWGKPTISAGAAPGGPQTITAAGIPTQEGWGTPAISLGIVLPPPPIVVPPPIRPGTFKIRIRDINERYVGVLDTYEEATFIPRWNGIGTFNIKIPAEANGALMLTAGCGVNAVMPDGYVFSGLVTSVLDEWSADDGNNGTITVDGVEDKVILGYRVVLPQWNADYTAQTAVATYTDTGPAETVIKNLVNRNLGSSALASRRLPFLAVSTDQGRGRAASVSSRYDNLLDQIQRIASPIGYGFNLVSDGAGGWRFDVLAPTDVSSTVQFSRPRGNLAAYSFGRTAPTVTRAVVGGSGTGAARNIRVYDAAAGAVDPTWGFMIEQFVDQRSDNSSAVLAQAGAEALTAGAEQTSLTCSVIDTPNATIGVDYFLGSRVGVVIRGATFYDYVSEVSYASTVDSFRITPTIGGADAVYGKALDVNRVVRSINARVALLERRY